MKTWKIVNTSPIPKEALSQLVQSFGGFASNLFVIEDIDRERGEDSLVEKIEQADILLGDFTFQIPITEKSLKHQKNLKLIQQPSAGFQQIDVDAARRYGVPVCNTGTANADAVAEFTVMAALLLLKNAYFYYDRLRQKKWVSPLEIRSREIRDKNICILGLGRIGRETAKRFKVFTDNLFYFDLVRNEAAENELGIKFTPLESLIKKADVFTVHLPLTSKTRNLISHPELRKFKASCYLVQVSRGGIFDEAALVQALEESRIAGAWLDVFASEPPAPDSPFYECPNVIISPHMAGVTEEARGRIIKAAIGNLARCIKGEPLEDVVMSYE